MELRFSTRSYKSKISKSATIYSNDLSDSQVRIRISAQVDPEPDTTLPFSYTPNSLQFTQDQKKLNVVFSNKSKRTMYLKAVGGSHGDLVVKMGDMKIDSGEDKEVEFSWKGEFEKENIEQSITFDVSASQTERVTIPFVVQGTDPTPAKQAAKKGVTPRQVKSGPKKQ